MFVVLKGCRISWCFRQIFGQSKSDDVENLHTFLECTISYKINTLNLKKICRFLNVEEANKKLLRHTRDPLIIVHVILTLPYYKICDSRNVKHVRY